MADTQAPTPIRLGNHLWATCGDCGKLVKLTGWLRGLHLCATDAERHARRALHQQRTALKPGEILQRLMRP